LPGSARENAGRHIGKDSPSVVRACVQQETTLLT